LSKKTKETKRTKKKDKPKANTHRKALLHLRESDPVLAAIIERIGPCKIEFSEPTFHHLAESILYQQLNGKAAATIFDRFTTAAGNPLTPQGIIKLTDAQMREVRPLTAEDKLSARFSGQNRRRLARLRASDRDDRRRRDRAPHAGQRRRRLDRPHVSDVHAPAPRHSAHRRLRRAGSHQKALQETQMAKARRNAKDRQAVGAISLDRLLVSLEKFGCKNN
jgi:hypothetical protein